MVVKFTILVPHRMSDYLLISAARWRHVEIFWSQSLLQKDSIDLWKHEFRCSSSFFFSSACLYKIHSQKTQWEWRHFKLTAQTQGGGWKYKRHRPISWGGAMHDVFRRNNSVHLLGLIIYPPNSVQIWYRSSRHILRILTIALSYC